MKKIFFLVVLFAIVSSLQSQNTDYRVTTNGIGSLILGMKQTELEKLLKTKIPLANITDTISGSWQDEAKVKYKNIPLTLYFQRRYSDDKTFVMELIGMESKSPLLKTASGIGIGTDKLKILTTYENNRIYIAPSYTDDTYTTISKTKASIRVMDPVEEKKIIFDMVNRKVVSIFVGWHFDDCE